MLDIDRSVGAGTGAGDPVTGLGADRRTSARRSAEQGGALDAVRCAERVRREWEREREREWVRVRVRVRVQVRRAWVGG